MKYGRIEQNRLKWFNDNVPYKLMYYTDVDFNIFDKIIYKSKSGRGDNSTYNDIIIMGDTETSKKLHNEANHICAWTISCRAFGRNIISIYGTRPTEFCDTLGHIIEHLSGKLTYVYFHNLPYDYVFLRQFLFRSFGLPIRQLNVKPHYPISIEFNNGLILKDSYILSQKSLNKWGEDLNVEHKKAVGKWEYNKVRNQCDYNFTDDEKMYIECDTLCGIECIDAFMHNLHKKLYSIPLTATGIPREEVQKRGAEHQAHERFIKTAPNYEEYEVSECVYHGGYTHSNRHLIGKVMHNVTAYDFASSYPYILACYKFPCEAWSHIGNKKKDYILNNMENYCYMFKFVATNIRLKDDDLAMPPLQYSKCIKTINAICDNGRVLCANYVELFITCQDLYLIDKYYSMDGNICLDVMVAHTDYLPRWFTDYVFELFKDKTSLKGDDTKAIDYAIKKGTLNSLYGMTVMKNIRDTYEEDYITGQYRIKQCNREDEYNKFIKKRTNVLPYAIGIFVTAYAMRNLFSIGECAETWVYSDTDSVYGIGWDMIRVNAYNESCKQRLKNNGYGCVYHNNREYWLGVAELDGKYSEYVTLGAKRYCGRTINGELKITVAGVPKKNGAKCLHDDIHNFKKGLIFDGKTTGKLTHNYIYSDKIYIDEYGNETADSINLTECDYLLDEVYTEDWTKLYEEIEVQIYEE